MNHSFWEKRFIVIQQMCTTHNKCALHTINVYCFCTTKLDLWRKLAITYEYLGFYTFVLQNRNLQGDFSVGHWWNSGITHSLTSCRFSVHCSTDFSSHGTYLAKQETLCQGWSGAPHGEKEDHKRVSSELYFFFNGSYSQCFMKLKCHCKSWKERD